MRRLFALLVVLALLPLAVFAEWGFGAAALYKTPVLMGQPVNTAALNVNQFVFGADLRFKQSVFQAEGLLVYSLGDVDSLSLYLDAGLALTVEETVRVSFGAGPNFVNNLGELHPLQVGLNAKLNGDVMWGPVSIGLTYIMTINFNNGIGDLVSSGLLGLQFLLWI